MKVAAFVGSPRNDGITDAVVKEVVRGTENGDADSSIYHIGLLHISGCRSCMKCRETGRCAIDDDMQPLFNVLSEVDCLVLGTPIYFYYMSAQMKAFTDRLFSTIGKGFKSSLGRKPAVLVVAQGVEDPDVFGDQIDNMKRAWKLAGIDVIKTVLACAKESAEDVSEDSELLEDAYSAGRKLAKTVH